MMDKRKIFEDAVELHGAGFPELVKRAMVNKGVPFSAVTRTYNKYMVMSGRALSKDDRHNTIIEVLFSCRYETEEKFKQMVVNIQKKIPNTSFRAASAIVRSHAKSNENPVWSSPGANQNPRVSFMKQFCDFVARNPQMSESIVIQYLQDDTADYVKRNINNYVEVWKMAQTIIGRQM